MSNIWTLIIFGSITLMIKFIDQLKNEELQGKKVLLRTDLDVPINCVVTEDGKQQIISEDFRIKAQKENLDYLLNNGAKVVMVAHISAVDSFEPIVSQLSEILGHKIEFISLNQLLTTNYSLQTTNLILVDNIRQDEREESNDEEFVTNLSNNFDLYVNNAFAVVHRNQASVSGVASKLPSYGGLLLRKELDNLSRAINEPAEGKVLILGGAKIATKLPVIVNFYDKAEKIIVGGALANNFFFQIFGIDVGSSLIDNQIKVNIKGEKIILPEDILVAQDKKGKGEISVSGIESVGGHQFIADIGPKSAQKFADIIKEAKMVIWNGPLGFYEVDKFSEGTNIIARAIAGSHAESIIGGGDTISAVNKLGLIDKFNYISTGGGSMLQFLAGEKLPGLEALGYYD